MKFLRAAKGWNKEYRIKERKLTLRLIANIFRRQKVDKPRDD